MKAIHFAKRRINLLVCKVNELYRWGRRRNVRDWTRCFLLLYM